MPFFENMPSQFHINDGIGIAVAGADFLSAGPSDAEFCEAFSLWYDQHPELRYIVLDLDAPKFARDFAFLLVMCKRVSARGGRLLLARPQPGVRVSVELSRLNCVFDVWGSVEEAIAAAKAGPLPPPQPKPPQVPHPAQPCNTMEPAKPDISSICKLETLERRGFKVVILRLTGDGYFFNTMEGLKALAREHAPGIGSAGEVTHFLLLDLANVGLISDWFSSFILTPIRANAPRDADGKIKRFVPAVALIDPTRRHQWALELLRFDRVLGYFADEAAACAAMTPHGFINLLPYAG